MRFYLLYFCLLAPLVAAMPPGKVTTTGAQKPKSTLTPGGSQTISSGTTEHDKSPFDYTKAVKIDMSKGLPKPKGPIDADEKIFEQEELKKTEDAKKPQPLESVSGGFWDSTSSPAAPAVVKGTRDISIFKRDISSRLRDCLKQARLTYITEKDSRYTELATPYNLRLKQNRADVIVLPEQGKVRQVQDAVKCAKSNRMKVQAKAGGHSYAAFSSGSSKGGMVIDLRYMADVAYRVDDKTASVGAGIRLGNLAAVLVEVGGRAISQGDCPSVGLAGHSLHGGFGYTSRMWGLSTDAITGLDVVTADGQTFYVSQNSKSQSDRDLYWGMRGAGDSLAIAVRIYIKTRSIPKNVIEFIYDLNSLTKSPKGMTDAFVKSQACLRDSKYTPKNLGLTVRVAYRQFRIRGYFFGTSKELRDAGLDACLRSALKTKATMEELSFKRALGRIAGNQPLWQTSNANNAKSNFYAQSILIPEKTYLSTKTMDAYFEYVINKGSSSNVKDQFTLTFRLMGGGSGTQIAAKGDTYSAVTDRTNLWVVQHDGNTSKNPRDVMRFITGLTDTIINTSKDGKTYPSFAPFVDEALSNDDAHKHYFKAAVYSKLRDIKTRWDPTDLFWNPQSVQPRAKK